jgi:hypothetical protein
MNFGSRRPIRKPLITTINKKKRVAWCKKYLHWTSDDWKRVLWSDESRFTIFCTDGHVKIWRNPHEAMDPSCLVPTVHSSGGGIMVWGSFSWSESY